MLLTPNIILTSLLTQTFVGIAPITCASMDAPLDATTSLTGRSSSSMKTVWNVAPALSCAIKAVFLGQIHVAHLV